MIAELSPLEGAASFDSTAEGLFGVAESEVDPWEDAVASWPAAGDMVVGVTATEPLSTAGGIVEGIGWSEF